MSLVAFFDLTESLMIYDNITSKISPAKQYMIISMYAEKSLPSTKIMVDAIKLPQATASIVCLKLMPKNTAIPVPVHVPVKGNGIDMNPITPSVLTLFAVFVLCSLSALFEIELHFSSMIFSTLSTKFLNHLIF